VQEVYGRYVDARTLSRIWRWASEENVITVDYIMEGLSKQLQGVVQTLQDKVDRLKRWKIKYQEA
jgi:hypothetical protein